MHRLFVASSVCILYTYILESAKSIRWFFFRRCLGEIFQIDMMITSVELCTFVKVSVTVIEFLGDSSIFKFKLKLTFVSGSFDQV